MATVALRGLKEGKVLLMRKFAHHGSTVLIIKEPLIGCTEHSQVPSHLISYSMFNTNRSLPSNWRP
jgi:hypothetical protein